MDVCSSICVSNWCNGSLDLNGQRQLPRKNTTRLYYITVGTMGKSWYAKHVVRKMGEWTETFTFADAATRWKTGATLPTWLWRIGDDAVKRKARWSAKKSLSKERVGIHIMKIEKNTEQGSMVSPRRFLIIVGCPSLCASPKLCIHLCTFLRLYAYFSSHVYILMQGNVV